MQVQRLGIFSGHKGNVYTFCLSQEADTFYSAGTDGYVVEWNLQEADKGKLLAKANSSVYAMCYCAEEQLLVFCQNYDGLVFYSLREKLVKSTLHLGKSLFLDCLYYQDRFWVASSTGHLYVINASSLQLEAKLEVSAKPLRKLCPDKGSLFIACSDGRIVKLNPKAFVKEAEIQAHSRSVFSLAVDPLQNRILSGSMDAHLKDWDIASLSLENDIVAHLYTINDLAFSSDGVYFASASKDKTIKIWESATRKLLKVIDKGRHNAHVNSVNKLRWLPNSYNLLSCSDDASLLHWRLDV